MSPRSILKHPQLPYLPNQQHFQQPFPFAACSSVLHSPRVHFPPTPTLTSTYTTHSASAYDRTPAVVPPNTCALPGRHEREFTIDASYSQHAHYQPVESYFHPRASEACAIEPSGYPLPPFPAPALTPDAPHHANSPGSDSDDPIATPPDPIAPPISVRFSARNTSSNPMIPYSHSQKEIESALSFLPHPHPPPLKGKKSAMRSHSQHAHHNAGPRKETRTHAHNGYFTGPPPEYDGCLGGF
jgi:hypothetical protein